MHQAIFQQLYIIIFRSIAELSVFIPEFSEFLVRFYRITGKFFRFSHQDWSKRKKSVEIHLSSARLYGVYIPKEEILLWKNLLISITKLCKE